MKIKEININEGQYLEDVMPKILVNQRPAIPTNTILNKVMTGCGATWLEIHSERHSIVIEPNVPVIIGKKAQHPFLFAVYEGTTREDVKAYLAGEEDGYRKIITYTLDTESGVSLRAVGWRCAGQAGGTAWTGTRKPKTELYPAQMKIRYEKML